MGLTQSVNFPTRISLIGKSSLLDFLQMPLALPLPQLVHLNHVLLKINISCYFQRAVSTPASLAVHSGRLAGTTSSHLSSGLVFHISTAPDVNSAWEFIHRNLLSFMHRFISSHLQLSFPSSHTCCTESCGEAVALKQLAFFS